MLTGPIVSGQTIGSAGHTRTVAPHRPETAGKVRKVVVLIDAVSTGSAHVAHGDMPVRNAGQGVEVDGGWVLRHPWPGQHDRRRGIGNGMRAGIAPVNAARAYRRHL